MPHSPFPKALYRKNGEECRVVKDEKEQEAATREGWGPHPSAVKPEPSTRFQKFHRGK